MGKRCLVCGNSNIQFFQIPNEQNIRMKWLHALHRFCDVSKIRDYTVICKNHFLDNDFSVVNKRCRLIKGAVPSIFNTATSSDFQISPPHRAQTNSQCIQVDVVSDTGIVNFQHQCKILNQKLKYIKVIQSNSEPKDMADIKQENIYIKSEVDDEEPVCPIEEVFVECSDPIKLETVEYPNNSFVEVSDYSNHDSEEYSVLYSNAEDKDESKTNPLQLEVQLA